MDIKTCCLKHQPEILEYLILLLVDIAHSELSAFEDNYYVT